MDRQRAAVPVDPLREATSGVVAVPARPVEAVRTVGEALSHRCEQYGLAEFAVFATAPFLLSLPWWLTAMWLGIYWMLARRS